MLSKRMGDYRITERRLGDLGEAGVTAQFNAALSTTNFLATSDQATTFVAGVVDVLAP